MTHTTPSVPALEPEGPPDGGLQSSLEGIAKEVMNLTGCEAVSILCREPDGKLRVIVAVGQDHHRGDLAAADIPSSEGRESVLTVPLMANSRDLGVLTLSRAGNGGWSREEVVLGSLFAHRAAGAITGARLFESQQLQVGALERMAGMLSEQAHDYANRLHAVSGLLALGETAEARRLLAELMALHHETSSAVAERVHDTTLSGLLTAQMSAGRQRGVEVRLHRASNVGPLPPTAARSELMMITANLVENAVDATVGMERSRRRVTIRLTEGDGKLTLTVRDWGEGVGPAMAESILGGAAGNSRPDPHGVGMAAVVQAVRSAGGEIEMQSKAPGTAVRVRLSLDL